MIIDVSNFAKLVCVRHQVSTDRFTGTLSHRSIYDLVMLKYICKSHLRRLYTICSDGKFNVNAFYNAEGLNCNVVIVWPYFIQVTAMEVLELLHV